MAIKSHLARSMDFRRPSNLLLAGMVLVSGAIAFFFWLDGDSGAVFSAPVFAFLLWSVVREMDPDHDWTALSAGLFAAVWVLAGGPVISGFAVGGLLIAARIMTSTTGRRPLRTDLAAVSAFGIAIGFTVEGWVAGFGIAIAFYLDDRLREERRLDASVAAAITAIGTTVVATAARAFPDRLPDVIQYLAVAAGVISLLLLTRDPAIPTTTVDARYGAFLDKARLHVSRSVLGVLVFLITIVTGIAAEGAVVLIAALGLAVVSNEIELLRRRGQ